VNASATTEASLCDTDAGARRLATGDGIDQIQLS